MGLARLCVVLGFRVFAEECWNTVAEVVNWIVSVNRRKSICSDIVFENLIRALDSLLLLDILKNMKACLSNDFSYYRRFVSVIVFVAVVMKGGTGKGNALKSFFFCCCTLEISTIANLTDRSIESRVLSMSRASLRKQILHFIFSPISILSVTD